MKNHAHSPLTYHPLPLSTLLSATPFTFQNYINSLHPNTNPSLAQDPFSKSFKILSLSLYYFETQMEGGSMYRKGLWTEEEDRILMDYIRVHGKGKWNQVARVTGLKRCGKSCRLRWINYLSPNVKRGDFSEEEEDLIIRLHNLLGNRWSLIAGRVPGRTDNQVKNHWNTHLSKKLGVKKGKFKVTGSSKTCAREVVKCPLVHSELNSEVPFNGNSGDSGPEAAQDSSKCTTGFGSSQENGVNETSFWFSSNDDFNLYTPSLMEFLDSYSLDFDLHSL